MGEAGAEGILAQGTVVVAVHAHAGDGQKPRLQLRAHLVGIEDRQFGEVAEGPGQAVAHVRIRHLQLGHRGHRLFEGHVQFLFRQLFRGQVLVLSLKEGLYVGDGFAAVLELDLAGDAIDRDGGHVFGEKDAVRVKDLPPIRIVGAHQHGVAPLHVREDEAGVPHDHPALVVLAVHGEGEGQIPRLLAVVGHLIDHAGVDGAVHLRDDLFADARKTHGGKDVRIPLFELRAGHPMVRVPLRLRRRLHGGRGRRRRGLSGAGGGRLGGLGRLLLLEIVGDQIVGGIVVLVGQVVDELHTDHAPLAPVRAAAREDGYGKEHGEYQQCGDDTFQPNSSKVHNLLCILYQKSCWFASEITNFFKKSSFVRAAKSPPPFLPEKRRVFRRMRENHPNYATG